MAVAQLLDVRLRMQIVFSFLCLMAMSAVVSFALGAFVRSRPMTLWGSLIITELIFLILIYRDIASSSDAAEVFLVPVYMAVVIAPIIFLTTWATSLTRRG